MKERQGNSPKPQEKIKGSQFVRREEKQKAKRIIRFPWQPKQK